MADTSSDPPHSVGPLPLREPKSLAATAILLNKCII